MFAILRKLLLASLLPASLAAQPGSPLPLMADDPVAARLDDLAALPWVKNSPLHADTAKLNIHGFPATYIPAWPEATYQSRLAALDGHTPFSLTYNPVVQSFIDLYAVRKREMTSRMLGLSDLYFPVFEEYLDKHQMPLELKYLAVVESALNPSARSRASAVGLWQFMLPTGKMFGLKATSYVDERHDVYQSTEAACKYLKYLYNMYGNWELALAAYNCGPGNVNKAIRRSGGEKDYWKIYDHLPRETRGYVPAFIAVNYVFAHAADHNLYPVVPTYCAHQVDTVQVCYPLDLASVARLTGASTQEVLDLNPTFKLGVVPDVNQPVTVYLPKRAAGVFVTNEDSIQYAFFQATPTSKPAPSNSTNAVADAQTVSVPKMHTVRRGESLGVIANKYRISVTELKKMNGLRGTTIHAGQKLKVGRTTKTVTAQATPKPVDKTDLYIYYEVQPGDTLWNIAERYPGTTVDDLRRMNSELENEGLKPGRKIKVGVQEG
ncbi:MAG: LysM peptidoglycan-binding domain-containing protein [Flavobacteriales bacterium]|nr:LysM peptidoglycan-binding domain-containing protein [Flavobacteriales bacterium]